MSTYTVARDDFRNSVGSLVVLGIVAALVAIVALTFAAESGQYDDPYRTLFDVTQAIILLGPVLVAPLAYQCIVDERTSGRITFHMGLPNSRAEYFAGKLLSRFGVVLLAVGCSMVLGFGVAALTFTNTPDIGRFAVFTAATALYLLSFVSIYFGISALVTGRTTAMMGALAMYFLLIPFWGGFTPFVNLDTLLTGVGNLLGTPLSDATREAIRTLSPWKAYGGSTVSMYADIGGGYQQLPSIPPGKMDDMYRQTARNVLALLGWSAAFLLVGYAKFRTAELR
ncbi:cbb3-type cytochrome oxidase assembly protein CcoS [Haladaptatus sp. DYF46]|uniref:ABC transporter permease n=1 Tax=Haladaptatus sp. DYF46 TaxID=2886041 RepID=UPI001E4DB725|nr:cbb3-type cytochrome oxidase assembly protein CcoS [Haladaptatus sp. DYF46]